jgi:hypothetical protein
MASLKSILPNPASGVGVGLGTGIAVYLIYNSALPPHADIRAADANNTDIEAARHGAAAKSAGLIGLIFLVTRDVHAFIVSGAMLTGIDYMAKHHNAINPASGKLDTGGSDSVAPMASVHSLPDYGEAESYGS